MQVCYANDPMPESFVSSIFLAGPTPRAGGKSWRDEALDRLAGAGYEGIVFVPQPKDSAWRSEYEGQVEWELEALQRSDCILFWVPRDLDTLPGFTTNDEWGAWKYSGRCVFGAPLDAPKTHYQKWYAEHLGIPSANNLADTVRLALSRVGVGDLRIGAETEVPLEVWYTPGFQRWYAAQKGVGNELRSARVEWVFRVGSRRMICFWALHASIYVASERRVKDNEVVMSRPDTASMMLYHVGARLDDAEILLVREFRVAASNSTATVLELPGGSTWSPGTAMSTLAIQECREETGISISSERLVPHGQRQFMATMSAHQGALFSVEMTPEEWQAVRSHTGEVWGSEGDGAAERTTLEIHRFGDLKTRSDIDWSTLGMCASVLGSTS